MLVLFVCCRCKCAVTNLMFLYVFKIFPAAKYSSIILFFALTGFDTWSFTFGGKSIIWGCLKTMCWGKWVSLKERNREKCIMTSFMTLPFATLYSDDQYDLNWIAIKDVERGEACGTYGRAREQHTGFWRVIVKERCHLEDLGADERIILKCIFKKEVGMAWTGFVRLGIGTSGGLLWTR
jgi:hypothetical protein